MNKIASPSTRHKNCLRVCSLNARTLSSEEDRAALYAAADRISWDVISIQESKAKKPLNLLLQSGHSLLLGPKVPNKNIGGMGFYINCSVLPLVDSFEFISPRLAVLRLKPKGQEDISIINAYAPTSAADEEEREEFYSQLLVTIRKERTFYKIVCGDFNATIGQGVSCGRIGKYGLGTRNENGDRLADLLSEANLYHGNSMFNKAEARRWTWKSPNGSTVAEIDHILCNRRWSLYDVSTVPSFSSLSDHRLVRAKVNLRKNLEKKILHRPAKPSRPTYCPTLLQSLIEDRCISISDGPISSEYNSLCDTLTKCGHLSEVPPSKRPERLSEKTKFWLRKRRMMLNDPETSPWEQILANWNCRRSIKSDIREFRSSRLLQAAVERKSIKKTKAELSEGRQFIVALKDEQGDSTTSRIKIEDITKQFYTSLFKSDLAVLRTPSPPAWDEVEDIMPCEVEHVIKLLRPSTASGPDNISAALLKAGGPPLHRILANLFSRCLKECTVPDKWKTSNTVLLYKKGDQEDIGNYRPISLLSIPYKLFTKTILRRIEVQLDDFQPVEQAGFRRGFSCMDHIHTLTQIIERCREYHLPLVVIFVDYKKAFDSIEINVVLNALLTAGIDPNYVNLLEEINEGSSTTIKLFDRILDIPTGKGVRQGDTISPKLFVCALQDAMKNLDWDDKGIRIDGKCLNNIRFADDIAILSHSPTEAESMLHELNVVGKRLGLQINRKKTETMRNRFAPMDDILLEGTALDCVDSYVYLGREVRMDNSMSRELSRRKRSAWKALSTITEVTDHLKDISLRAEIFNSTVLPALCYAAETWPSNNITTATLRTTHRALERRLLNTNLFKQRANGTNSKDLRRLSLLKDPIRHVNKAKLRWAGHIMRRDDDRWTRLVTEWYPREIKRPLGRPPSRWADFIQMKTKLAFTGYRNRPSHWSTHARDRSKWKEVVIRTMETSFDAGSTE